MKQKNKKLKILQKAGYNVIPLSCLKGTGFEKLEEVLKDRITVCRSVRSRKSTILNKIMNSYVMETGDVSRKMSVEGTLQGMLNW